MTRATEADSTWMGAALDEADLAAGAGEVPVGCVIVDVAGQELARGRNGREALADPKAGAITTMFAIGLDARLNHRFAVTAGVRAADCAEKLQAFFSALRERP